MQNLIKIILSPLLLVMSMTFNKVQVDIDVKTLNATSEITEDSQKTDVNLIGDQLKPKIISAMSLRMV
ncbi:hypothetical protein EG341_03220 [Chryseobacterium lactis]|uniref:Uncharacterized protein n=1 Tax=Chryseobacterium lactis TaxID=1241981 RepID=A0ABM7AYA4_CHRLC|nr:hypothetical protein [Chryseobacterium lactis]AZA82624.1 hypothetical protein EG342_12360 [Chryseobacterium lactis]AZB03005.1 hypothetical protein EG341_03220 [Chryseobacterium lactis]